MLPIIISKTCFIVKLLKHDHVVGARNNYNVFRLISIYFNLNPMLDFYGNKTENGNSG